MNDEDFIGLDMQDALECCQAHGIICCIAGDEKLTFSYSPSRLIFTFKDGKVISVDRG